MAGWELNFCDLHKSGERAVEIYVFGFFKNCSLKLWKSAGIWYKIICLLSVTYHP